MADPIVIKKSIHTDLDVVRWNEFINFLGQPENKDLSEIQRIASISNWFNSELLNGGFEQYFYNLGYFEHDDVVNALVFIGAICQSVVLEKVMEYYHKVKDSIPTDYNEYIKWNEQASYENKINEFNLQYYDCRPEIETNLLMNILDKYEFEFIRWE